MGKTVFVMAICLVIYVVSVWNYRRFMLRARSFGEKNIKLENRTSPLKQTDGIFLWK